MNIKILQRVERMRQILPGMENEIVEHRSNPQYLYRVEEARPTNDTIENRFLKFAISQIYAKYSRFKVCIELLCNVSDFQKEEMECIQTDLKHLKVHPFFRTVGNFNGISQESLVLQRADGYSRVYRIWNVLKRGYSLVDGLYRLQTKNIATLYEIWCFIEISHIVKDQFSFDDVQVLHCNRMELSSLFNRELGRGERSKISFIHNDKLLAELMYNAKTNSKQSSRIGVENLVSLTVPQKPDIVLQLVKDDLMPGMKFTYLFDAKYRIAGKINNVDYPPDDAINQMHRYRDAIYYRPSQSEELSSEIIGGYILFPGTGEFNNILNSRFFRSIDRVNIGAFPMKPHEFKIRNVLETFINDLIRRSSYEIIDRITPYKGTSIKVQYDANENRAD